MHLLSGTEAGIRLYLDEIVSITCSALTSQSWTTKAQAAVTISAIALKLGKIVNFKELFSLVKAMLKLALNALIGGESFRKLSLEDNERILEGKFRPQTQCFHLTS